MAHRPRPPPRVRSQGVFAGQGVYDAETETRTSARAAPSPPASGRGSDSGGAKAPLRRQGSARGARPSAGAKGRPVRSASRERNLKVEVIGGQTPPPVPQPVQAIGGQAAVAFTADGSQEAAAEDERPRTALERMRELKELLDDGLLSQGEYEAKRLAILNDL